MEGVYQTLFFWKFHDPLNDLIFVYKNFNQSPKNLTQIISFFITRRFFFSPSSYSNFEAQKCNSKADSTEDISDAKVEQWLDFHLLFGYTFHISFFQFLLPEISKSQGFVLFLDYKYFCAHTCMESTTQVKLL